MAVSENFGTVDMSTPKNMEVNKPKVNALSIFNTPRVEGEPDLVAIINKELCTIYGDVAGAMFVNSADIVNIKDLNPISQRIIINRWFTTALFIYRSINNDKDVNEILLHIINDGTVNEWKDQLTLVVIEFFKIRNVLGIAKS